MRNLALPTALGLILAGLGAAAQAQDAASAAPAAPAAPTATVCIDVEVQNVRPQQGLLFLVAYGSAETYGKKALSSVKAAAGDATTRLQMCGISGDTVAIQMFQDLDSDGKMGKNIMGMPTEPWGSSGTPGMFGPSWETGKVTLNGSAVVVKLSQ
jgi:uncharacterized protein (DUF2141 family)